MPLQSWSPRSCALVACLVAADGLSLGGTSGSPPPVAPAGGGLQAEPAPFDVDVGLWDGRDDSEGEYLSYDLRPNASSASRTSAEASAKVFVMLGPQDSGTNLMEKLILNNFAGLKSSHTVSEAVLWKHTLAGGAARVYAGLPGKLKPQKMEETSAIMIIRSPLSQIVSWKRLPYDMCPCACVPYERMNESCSALRGVSVNSTVEIYNKYVQQYRQIQADGKFMNAHLFSYEDVVYSTEEVLHALAKLLGKPMPDVMYLGERSAKGPKGIGRMQAKEKIEKRSYLDGISTSQQAILCQGLDYELADMIVEGSYLAKGDPKRKPHSYDCRAHRPR